MRREDGANLSSEIGKDSETPKERICCVDHNTTGTCTKSPMLNFDFAMYFSNIVLFPISHTAGTLMPEPDCIML